MTEECYIPQFSTCMGPSSHNMPFFKNPLFLAILGGIVAGSAIALNLVLWNDDPIEPRPLPAVSAQTGEPEGNGTPPQTETTTDASSTAAAVESVSSASTAPVPTISPQTPPTFDVVRVTPDGNAVIAGRAVPGQTIEILDGDRVIGTVKADDRGEWVFVPGDALLPGNRQLSLRANDPATGMVESDQIVMVVVPERDEDKGDAIAVAASKQGDTPSQVLQIPGSSSPAVLAIDAVDYDQTGEFSLSGRASPGALVNIYLDNTYVGTAQADTDGRWSLIPETRVKPGRYELRADQVSPQGVVQERISMPFMRDEVTPELTPGNFYVVQPGNSLWRIARRTYGEGLSFTVIYKANKDQIGDPDLIYPGQIFTLPEG